MKQVQKAADEKQKLLANRELLCHNGLQRINNY
ncbi:hypothetical protein J2S01_002693 [Pectinatus haikarae]|uniref:Uncharacterized protein n=1 Tax=Pectinatus haikarae TaxID=349096 RepID=A0ABT9YD32_9FIRM|nr:hypothetical protein [Pectinatus haikarae]